MQHRFLTVLVSAGFILTLAFGGCASQQSVVVATINGTDMTLDDFNAMYEKNNGGKEAAQKASLEDREKFLDLFIKFRLKVLDAYAHGYQHDSDVQAELQQYRRNLAVTYLIDKEISGPSLQRMYERRLVELRASHILIQLPPNPIPPDTLQAYKKAMAIIDSLQAGRNFEELALNNSQDPSVKTNKGDLYYFSSGSMVPEFEEAAFSVPAGAVVPYPVRTQFGYHVIKVFERNHNPGTLRVSHIMKRLTPGSTPEDSAKALNDLRAVLDSLKHGAKFEALANEYSDDNYSKERGGDLGFIARRRTVKEFDEVIFKMKAGETSGIVKTPYGYHVIRVTEVKPVGSFQSMEQELRNFYQQYRFQSEYDWYVNKLKQEYDFFRSPEAVSAWHASLDTAKTTADRNWDSSFTATVRAKDLFMFAGTKVTIDSVIRMVRADQELQGLALSLPATSDKILDKTSKDLVVERKARSMESSFADFAKTIKDYEEGSMLFKAEQNAVWGKVTANDSMMHIYFDANRSKYTWPDRVNYQEIFVPTDSVAKVVMFLLKKQKLPFDSVAAQFNTRQTTKEKNGEWGKLPITTNDLTQRAWKMNEGDVSDPIPFEHEFSIIKVLEKDAARDKTFSEAGSELSSAFQEYESKRLESAWEDSLRQKYPVKVYKEALLNPPGQPSKN